MKYKDFTIEDFLKDEYFVSWVTNPTAESEYFWKVWMETHPEKITEVSRAREIIASTQYKYHFTPTTQEFIEVLESIHRGEKSGRSTKHFSFSVQIFYRYAAAILIMIFAGSIFWYWKKQPVNDKNPVAIIEKQTIKGQKLLVKLPDGSTVKLNAETSIRYAEDFGQTNREIYLLGEAYFEVTPDKSKPFTIHTGDLLTTVVGTSFNINSYPEKDAIHIAVLTGEVKVRNNTRTKDDVTVSLHPNEMASFDKALASLDKREADVQEIIAWKDNVIQFKDADFQEIKHSLERWFGVSFIIPEDMKIKEEFSGRFEDESLERILDALNYTSNYSYTLKGKQIFVSN